jgi:putative hemolysin
MSTQPHVFDSARRMLPHNRLLEPILFPRELETAWAASQASARGIDVFSTFLDRLKVRWTCAVEDLSRIPKTGPLVVVANHPFGMVEGAVLGALLGRVRQDVRFLANSLLAGIPGLENLLIPVDPFGGATRGNWIYLRHSLDWLRRGGVLVTFPAGEVASLQLPKFQVADPQWNDAIGGILRLSHAPALAIYFHGANGPAFQIAGLVNPKLRTALLPLELLNKRGAVIRTSIGRPIASESLAHLPNDAERTAYLRQRTHLLESRHQQAPAWSFGVRQAPIAAAVPASDLRREIARLSEEHVLAAGGAFQVFTATASEIPNTLREIGRLRELTFRAAGEGTGRSLDLDRFDSHYRHLWIWNKEAGEVCGAYRMVGTDEVPSHAGLYTSTLFRFRPGLIESMHPALELGRSFVCPHYQKSYQALLLLWKGIGAWVARNPRYRILFGPVSISKEYGDASRALIVSYFEKRSDSQLKGAAEPRRGFKARRLRGCDVDTLAPMISGIDELSDAIADIEPDGKGLPVLLRQYLNLGGTMLAFNVDNAFSNVVDGLVVVDLRRLTPRLLSKYLGKAGGERFQTFQNTL